METLNIKSGKWFAQCNPHDGARIAILRYDGINLLTQKPPDFRPPLKDFGEYENRPVYGYDDCFPTVDACANPDNSGIYRDHGELCWRNWNVRIYDNTLTCEVKLDQPHVTFTRKLAFYANTLRWHFKLQNHSNQSFPFLHVMHALMPVQDVQTIELPRFEDIVDERTGSPLLLNHPDELSEHLLRHSNGSALMLLVRKVKEGKVCLGFADRLIVSVHYDRSLFPTLGIWWNKAGYPDEAGLRRKECAFEPITGSTSNLERSFRDGTSLIAGINHMDWEIVWRIDEHINTRSCNNQLFNK